MTPEEQTRILEGHARNLGGLISDLQGLEFLLRAFLQQLPTARSIGLPHGTDIYSCPVNTKLPVSELTSYDSLRTLITKYNAEANKLGKPSIDENLADIRDALAHGRVSASEPGANLRLLKFSKPKDGYVSVTFSETMSSEWFTAQKKRVFDAMLLVHGNLPVPDTSRPLPATPSS
jgi:hypothetical protein